MQEDSFNCPKNNEEIGYLWTGFALQEISISFGLFYPSVDVDKEQRTLWRIRKNVHQDWK